MLALVATIGLTSCSKRESDVVGHDTVHGSLCVQCHGDNLHGTATGPPLSDLDQHWTEAKLVVYLQNPRVYIETDERLQALRRKYKTEMPAFVMNEQTRRAVARYLLTATAGER
jgi:mono/diheme cytochrome c family protein